MRIFKKACREGYTGRPPRAARDPRAPDRRLAGFELVTGGRRQNCPWGLEITRLKK